MRVIYGRPPDYCPSLFAGQAWQDAAECWAAVEDLGITQWRVDQRFAVGPQWYTVTWRDGPAGQLGEWVIEVVEES